MTNLGKVVRIEKREDGIDIVAELSVDGVSKLKEIGLLDDSST